MVLSGDLNGLHHPLPPVLRYKRNDAHYMVMAEITIDLDKCEGAGQCVAYCPGNVYKL
jgi:ferredoxin